MLYMGLQGSYLRGEARENSDIDIMVILDRFSVRDMDTYRGILKEIGFYERSCGFICGKDEMKRWNPLEVCQLRHTTKDLVGDLADYLPTAAREDEINYVKLSLETCITNSVIAIFMQTGSRTPPGFAALARVRFT